MSGRLGPVVTAAGALVLTACSSSAPVAGATGSTTSAAYRSAYAIGLEAYTYGLPLLVTDATFQTMTSVGVSQGAFGPVNQFNNVRAPNSASSTTVVAPGATSLSSIAWVDLSAEPQVLHVPEVKDHYFVLALIDPYTENVANLGSASGTTPGDYVLVSPAQRDVALPAGATRLDVDYARIWIIGSTQLHDASDIPAVNRIQDGYTLTPLSRYGTTPAPSASLSGSPSATSTPPVTHTPPTGVAFFDQLGQLLEQFPPPAADASSLERFASVGIGPGRSPSTDATLDADTLRGLDDAVAAGPAQVQQAVRSVATADAPDHAGYLLGGFGSYGTNYTVRAVVSQIGLGAFVSEQAVYAMTWSDAAGTALDGSEAYVLHLSKAPPTREGWSLTVYTDQGALVAGAQGHNALTNVSNLERNGDGSIDLYLQPQQPDTAAKTRNWLVTPSGQNFEVMWRLFAPEADSVSGIVDGTGWQPPAVRIRS
jgi:hypothetical protein